MSCSNCYNGCTEIVSDKCVKYTGVDVPILEIKTGDSLSYVEQALIQFLVSTLDGSGIKITIPQSAYCDVVTKYLPTCGDITVVTLFEALVKSACDLQEQITTIDETIGEINADYDVDCLTGVEATSGTHDVLQAVITKLCELGVDLTALTIDLETNYVKLADLDALIAAYLSSIGETGTKYYTKMVPYTAVEYYGSLTGNFDGTGAGIGDWEKIYLCNGQNNTPDKRGRVPVGATTTPGTLPMDADVIPGGFNPTYALNTKAGTNSVTLNVNQMPSHTHVPNLVIIPNPHNHSLNNGGAAQGGGADPTQAIMRTSPGGTFTTGPEILTIAGNLSDTGGGLPHANNQPALACYYIMYIP